MTRGRPRPDPQGQGHAVQGSRNGAQQPSTGYSGHGAGRLGVWTWEEAKGHLYDLGLWGAGGSLVAFMTWDLGVKGHL